MGDGTESTCAPGTICRYIPGQNWSPCVASDAESAIAGPQIPTTSHETPLEIPSADVPVAPISSQIRGDHSAGPTPATPVESPVATEISEDEDCEDEDEDGTGGDSVNDSDGINLLGAIEKPSSEVSTSEDTPLVAAPPTAAAATVPSSAEVPTVFNAAVETSAPQSEMESDVAGISSSPSSAAPSAAGPTSTGNTTSSVTGGGPLDWLTEKTWDNTLHTRGQASINPERAGAVGTCETKWEDIANVEPYYVAIDPIYFGTYHAGVSPFYSVCGQLIRVRCKCLEALMGQITSLTRVLSYQGKAELLSSKWQTNVPVAAVV